MNTDQELQLNLGQCLLCQMGHFAREFHIADHVTKITQTSCRQFCGYGARSVDNTDHQSWNTPWVNVNGQRSSIWFSQGLMGLFLLSQFCSSSCPRRRRAHLILKSCTTSAHTHTSQQTSTRQHVLITDSKFKSKILHATEICPKLHVNRISEFSMLLEALPCNFGQRVCLLKGLPSLWKTYRVLPFWTLELREPLEARRWINMSSAVCCCSRLRRGWNQPNLQ